MSFGPSAVIVFSFPDAMRSPACIVLRIVP
jgi:hypothetical protein